MNILVTGAAGFIGFHIAKRLLEGGQRVISIDNFNDYYDPKLKEDRQAILEKYPHYKMYRGCLEDLALIKKIFSENKIDKICHLAAQAGVRYSLTNPHTYVQSNLVGFVNLIDEAKNAGVKNFVYASSSSVYGKNEKIPFSIDDPVDNPISLYAATKKSNELIAHVYNHLFGMRCVGLRFFTVYGPYGRPDMALFLFAKAIGQGEKIPVFNYGKSKRDFTYIDDVVDGVAACLESDFSYEIFNLGNNKPVELEYFISLIEQSLGKAAIKEYLPLQPGDVVATFANIDYSKEKINFTPKTSIEEGIKRTMEWYKDYYQV